LANPVNASCRLCTLNNLASALLNGNKETQNISRAIHFYAELNQSNGLDKSLALRGLIQIYRYYDVDLAKETAYLQELVDLPESSLFEPLQPLLRLLQIYTTDGNTLNPTGALAISKRILAHPNADSATRSEAERTLSEFHTRHPEHAPQAA
jgi:hypothetical protein